MSNFATLLASYQAAKAKIDDYVSVWTDTETLPPMEWQEGLEPLADAFSEAMAALLLAPAPTFGALSAKLAIMAQEEIAKGWYRACEAIELAAKDADRLNGEAKAAKGDHKGSEALKRAVDDVWHLNDQAGAA